MYEIFVVLVRVENIEQIFCPSIFIDDSQRFGFYLDRKQPSCLRSPVLYPAIMDTGQVEQVDSVYPDQVEDQ